MLLTHVNINVSSSLSLPPAVGQYNNDRRHSDTKEVSLTYIPCQQSASSCSTDIPAYLINDSDIGVNEPLIAYDPRMPPPPIPASALLAQPTSTKEKRRSKPLFGLQSQWLLGRPRQRRQGRRTSKFLPLHLLREILPSAHLED